MGSISFKPNFAAVDKSLNIDIARKAKERVKRLNFKMIRDSMINSNEMLKNLLIAYQDVEPNWINVHNRLEEEKPKNMQVFLNSEITIEDILKEAEGDELAELALCVTLSNRIAHSVSDIMKKHIRHLADDKVDKETEYRLINGIRKQFNSSKLKRDPNYVNKDLENACYISGISIEKLKEEGFDKLACAEQTAFYLKEYSLMELLTVLKDRDDINYGFIDTINKNAKSQKAFVMDLPFYGQFSVHVMEPRLFAQAVETRGKEYVSKETKMPSNVENVRKSIWELLKDEKYQGKLHETKTVILKDKQNDETNKFLKSLQNLTEEEQIIKLNEQEKKDPRYGHHLKVAGGYDTRGDKNER